MDESENDQMDVVFLGHLKKFLDKEKPCASDSDVFGKVHSFKDIMNAVEETLKTSREALSMFHLRFREALSMFHLRLNL